MNQATPIVLKEDNKHAELNKERKDEYNGR